MGITIKDIAEKCGVGIGTVSRAINNHPNINEKTKAHILEVIKENNFIPNNSARNLKRTETKTIALLIKGIGNPFFQNMIRVFEEEIHKQKYSLILQRVEAHENEVDLALELIKEKRLKGIVFLGGYFSHPEEKLEQISVPFILSTIGMTDVINKDIYSSVAVDDIKESYKMVNYLCECGHKKIAVFAADVDDISISKLRVEGYKKALKERGIPMNRQLIRYSRYQGNAYSMENGYQLTRELLESEEEFTAIYALSDSMAIGACKALFEAGKQIPQDYSVAGFDDLDVAYYYNPSITTIRQPVEEMARETTRILMDRIQYKKPHNHKTFEGELIIRDSTRVLV